MRNVLLYFAVKYNGDWESIYKALERKEKISDIKLEEIRNENHDFISILDEAYPSRLKKIYKPPFVLFYKGDIKKLAYKLGIGVIGSREATDKGKANTILLVKDLKTPTIISGMAKGIDAESHLAALEFALPTIAVLGSGINNVYPKQNQELYDSIVLHGLVISEYPHKTPGSQNSFKERNRIISGLSEGIVIVEAKHKSGTMNTVKHALQQNKDIFCFPSADLANSGTNLLIKDGAKLIENAKDVLEEY